MNQLMWVSEWRIEPEDKIGKEFGWQYKITNGGVYCSAKDMMEAQKKLKREIYDEMNHYILNKIICPNCSKTFAEHEAERDYRLCLMNLALRDTVEVRNS